MLIYKLYRYTEVDARDKTFIAVANSHFDNPAIHIQMSTYDLLSGTLTFLLFVILTPFFRAEATRPLSLGTRP